MSDIGTVLLKKQKKRISRKISTINPKFYLKFYLLLRLLIFMVTSFQNSIRFPLEDREHEVGASASVLQDGILLRRKSSVGSLPRIGGKVKPCSEQAHIWKPNHALERNMFSALSPLAVNRIDFSSDILMDIGGVAQIYRAKTALSFRHGVKGIEARRR